MTEQLGNNFHIGKPVKVDEQNRIYYHPIKGVLDENGFVALSKSEYAGVIEFVVRESGSHRLVTTDGKIHYVSPGFVGITITPKEAGQWTV